MKSAGKARNDGLYRHIRTSKEIIRNLLNDSPNVFNRFFWQIRNHFNMKSITKEKTDERP